MVTIVVISLLSYIAFGFIVACGLAFLGDKEWGFIDEEDTGLAILCWPILFPHLVWEVLKKTCNGVLMVPAKIYERNKK